MVLSPLVQHLLGPTSKEILLASNSRATMPKNPKQTDFELVRIRNTWCRIKKGETIHDSENETTVSQAKIAEHISDGEISWTIEAPIFFCYKVVETLNLLDPSNKTLLYGHITDQKELERALNSERAQRRFIVMDMSVDELYGPIVKKYFEANYVHYKILSLSTTEETKSIDTVLHILEEVQNFSIDRRTEPIIAIGGGACLDIVGLAASLYRRRTPYIRVPTTLLSYVDASVGAKNGVNFLQCKNKLGSYVPPVATFLDRTFIKTVPRQHIANGLGEILKMALMKHRGLFNLLKSHGKFLLDTKFQSHNGLADHGDAALKTTRIAIETMLEELAPNLWEDDLNRLVDFGHLISPELEMRVLPSLMHGEAVNIDMAYMTYLSYVKGLLSDKEKDHIIQCMTTLELPVWHEECTWNLIKKALMERMKHSAGQMRMPLPTGLGTAGTLALCISVLWPRKKQSHLKAQSI
ncbi:2-epi-5-epi-valiolone synthase-like [Hemicordylus capensis]|uniref:2-epi-5-epi-valiolone synthase-like n=1 Tax=Hemicordylus capensis TaxID=884348 RepID=UPI002302D82B|nr:2-epi-5-epi-valiolone synthase-like [Hemicordylus capensis]